MTEREHPGRYNPLGQGVRPGPYGRHPADSQRDDFSIPLGSATSGRLVFTTRVKGVTLVAEPGLHTLARGRYLNGVAWVGFEGGVVMAAYQAVASPDPTAAPSPAGGEIALNAAIPWEVEFRGSASRVTARLGALQLRSLDLLGGASDLTLELSRPEAAAYLYLTGGVRRMTILRPVGAGVRVHSQDGIAGLILDGRRFRRISSDTRLESADFSRNSCRYEISISGLASELTIQTR